MSIKNSKSLGPLSLRFNDTVGPARTGALSLLVWTISNQTPSDSEKQVPEDAVLAACAKLHRAYKMLDEEYADLLGTHKLPADLVQHEYQNAVAALREIGPIVTRRDPSLAEVKECLAKLPGLTTYYFDRLEPALNVFLGKLTDALMTERDQRIKAEGRHADTALKEVQRVAASIRMVAINASVEAARAGEAGAGFSVIAAETQALANKVRHVIDDVAQVLRG